MLIKKLDVRIHKAVDPIAKFELIRREEQAFKSLRELGHPLAIDVPIPHPELPAARRIGDYMKSIESISRAKGMAMYGRPSKDWFVLRGYVNTVSEPLGGIATGLDLDGVVALYLAPDRMSGPLIKARITYFVQDEEVARNLLKNEMSADRYNNIPPQAVQARVRKLQFEQTFVMNSIAKRFVRR